MDILLTGSSGLIGQSLVSQLSPQHRVVLLFGQLEQKGASPGGNFIEQKTSHQTLTISVYRCD